MKIIASDRCFKGLSSGIKSPQSYCGKNSV